MGDCLRVERAGVGALVSNVRRDVDDQLSLHNHVVGSRLFQLCSQHF